MNKEVTEQDLECETISSRNYVIMFFHQLLDLNKENFKYVFERQLLHILQQ